MNSALEGLVSYACAGMRCASCGTQNEPNSRFCGGCGARLPAGENRIAPTQKITTGANEVQPRAQQVTPAPLPVSAPSPIPGSSAPVTIQQRPGTPQPQRAPSAPPGGPPSAPMAAPPGSEPPRISTGPRNIPGSGGGIPATGLPPSPSRPVHASAPLGGARAPSRRGLLIIGVLVLDLCLAAAGTWMLIEGLSAGDPPPPPPAKSEPASRPPGNAAAASRPPSNAAAAAGEAPGRPADTVAAGEAPAAPTAPAAPADASSSGGADAPPASEPTKPAAAQGRKPKPAKKPARGGSAGGAKSAPIDPYGEPDPLPPEHRPPPPPPRRPAPFSSPAAAGSP